jgi:hypothetical protein
LYYCNIASRRGLCVTYKMGFGLDDWIYCTLYIHTTRNYRQLQHYRSSTHFAVHRYTHALGFSVFSCPAHSQSLYQLCYHHKILLTKLFFHITTTVETFLYRQVNPTTLPSKTVPITVFHHLVKCLFESYLIWVSLVSQDWIFILRILAKDEAASKLHRI